MGASSIRKTRLRAALGVALGIMAAGSGGVAIEIDKPGVTNSTSGADVNGVNSAALTNEILNQWQPIAVQLGLNAASWREMFATQLGMMDPSVLPRIGAVAADANNAKASYARFTQAFRSAEMQSYMLAESKRAQLKLGSPTTDQIFIPIVPCRIVDTRNVGGPISAGATRNFFFWSDNGGFTWANQGGAAGTAGTACPGTVAPNGGNPSAAMVTVTVVSPTAAGNFILWGGASPIPNASALNWTGPGQILANTTVIPAGGRSGSGPGGTIGDFAVEYNGPSGSAQFVADVVGYFVENRATALDCVAGTEVDLTLTAPGFYNQYGGACPTGYQAVSVSCQASGVSGSFNTGNLVMGGGGAVDINNANCFGYYFGSTSLTIEVTPFCCRVPGK